MIERHYFGEKLLKNFDFNFGFCVPNSRNTVEHIYEFPVLDKNESMFIQVFSTVFFLLVFFFKVKNMIASPYMTKSDTFYFVDNKLIMHNKADYAYNAE
jgi:hypothetical protein